MPLQMCSIASRWCFAAVKRRGTAGANAEPRQVHASVGPGERYCGSVGHIHPSKRICIGDSGTECMHLHAPDNSNSFEEARQTWQMPGLPQGVTRA